MSERLPPPDEPDEPALVPVPVPVPDPDDEELDEPDELVEYFVDVLELSACVTSVPKSVHSSQTSSSAPSIFTRFGEATSFPHISHWTDPLSVMFSP
jgi:hypothetical protein